MQHGNKKPRGKNPGLCGKRDSAAQQMLDSAHRP